jgi:uncharacterized protein YcbX
MLKVCQLTIYPVKGLAGINVTHAKANIAGFEHDRRWMLIDVDNRFISQRTDKRLALIQIELNPDNLIARYQDQFITFGINESIGAEITTDVWDDKAYCYEVSPKLSKWFSEILGLKVRMVKLKNETSRIHHSSITSSDIPVSLADGYPYLIVGTASIDELSNRMNQKIDISRFRPNIVLTTTEAHEEDLLKSFTIGSATFTNIKPCARCQVITIDQSTGLVDKNVLKTLSTYRTVDNNVYFGTNVVCKDGGVVRVGDDLSFS